MRCRPGAGVLLLALAATVAHAHRAPGSLTTIEFNESTDKVEVVHRLHSHDAELGVGKVIGDPRLRATDLESRAKIALYVEAHFAIRAGGEILPLELVGAEVAGDYLLVYQEREGRLPARIAVRDDILRDAFPGQVNQVNVTDGELVRTLAFAGDDEWHEFAYGNRAAANE